MAENNVANYRVYENNVGVLELYKAFNVQNIKWTYNPWSHPGMFQYQTKLITNFYDLNSNYEYLMLNRVPTFFNGFQLVNLFADCHNLPGPPFIGWESIYENCNKYINNWKGSGIRVKNLEYNNSTENMFHNCYNLYGNPDVFEEAPIETTRSMYENCYNLSGNAVFPLVAEDISRTYYGCNGLTGSNNISLLATNLAQTFYNCTNMSGGVRLVNTITNMCQSFYNCQNLGGNVVIPEAAVDMYEAYYNCRNVGGVLTSINRNINIIGAFENTGVEIETDFTISNITNLEGTFAGCPNVRGTIYLTSNGTVSAHRCFENRNTSTRLNIVVGENTDWSNWMLNVGTLCGVTPVVWTETFTKYINAQYNIYLYAKQFTPYNDNIIPLNNFTLDVNTTSLEFVQGEV